MTIIFVSLHDLQLRTSKKNFVRGRRTCSIQSRTGFKTSGRRTCSIQSRTGFKTSWLHCTHTTRESGQWINQVLEGQDWGHHRVAQEGEASAYHKVVCNQELISQHQLLWLGVVRRRKVTIALKFGTSYCESEINLFIVLLIDKPFLLSPATSFPSIVVFSYM